jgi:hypothetical protein
MKRIRTLKWKSSLMASVAVASLLLGSDSGEAGDWSKFSDRGWWSVGWKVDGDGDLLCQSYSEFGSTGISFNAWLSDDGSRNWIITFRDKNWKWVKADYRYELILTGPTKSMNVIFFGRPNADRITFIISIPILLGLIAFGLYVRDYILLASCILIAFAIGTLNRSSLHLRIQQLPARPAGEVFRSQSNQP